MEAYASHAFAAVINRRGKYVYRCLVTTQMKGNCHVSATSALETTWRDRSGTEVPRVHLEVRLALVSGAPAFMGAAFGIMKQVAAAPGVVGYSPGSHLPGLSFYTLSA